MSYLVLARKYRPNTFEEVVGQSHITDILTNAITSDRLGQAYLFCGPRGIGKTSCARILSKALNCEQGVTAQPCGTCSACVSITKGNSFDVLEIDGASNRGIDEIRTIRENVKFAPSYGRYKVYIVDEVHMLTTEAFNALLKTLEEPPEHVKFVFATTDPNKLPATIISRCQRFDFKRISFKELCSSLEMISGKETIKIEQDAIYAIAKAAKGSFRDALSVLDQVSALSEKTIKGSDVYSMLGLVELDLLFALVEALGQANCIQALIIFDTIIDRGKDIKQLGKDLIEHFRHLMILKLAGSDMDKIKDMGKLVDYPSEIKNAFLKQTPYFELKEILTAIDIFIATQEIARVTESERTPMEIAFAKLILSLSPRPSTGDQATSSDLKTQESASGGTIIRNQKGQVNATDTEPDFTDFSFEKPDSPEDQEIEELGVADPAVSESNVESLALELGSVKQHWNALTHAVSRERMSLATYLQEAVPVMVKDNRITIGFALDHTFFKETLEASGNLELVEKIFSEKFQTKVGVRYELMDKIEQVTTEEEHPMVKDVLEEFGGEIESRWHNE